MTDQNVEFETFMKKNRRSCIITGFGLFVLLWSTVSTNIIALSRIGKILGSLILIYAAYCCFSTAFVFIKDKPDIFKNANTTHEKTSIIFNNVFGIILILLIVYSFLHI